VLIYNIPYRTGRGLGAESLLELAAVDGIAGAKQAVGSIDGDTLTVLASAPDGFAMLAGDDLFIYPLMLLGGRGAIAASAQTATGRFAEMVDAALAGRIDEGRAHHEALLPLAHALFAEPSPAVIKAVLHAQGRIATPDVRMPLANATEAAAERALAATP
jgi:4-hydroxy-tetrahydrodipicolinate synthase